MGRNSIQTYVYHKHAEFSGALNTWKISCNLPVWIMFMESYLFHLLILEVREENPQTSFLGVDIDKALILACFGLGKENLNLNIVASLRVFCLVTWVYKIPSWIIQFCIVCGMPGERETSRLHQAGLFIRWGPHQEMHENGQLLLILPFAGWHQQKTPNCIAQVSPTLEAKQDRSWLAFGWENTKEFQGHYAKEGKDKQLLKVPCLEKPIGSP